MNHLIDNIYNLFLNSNGVEIDSRKIDNNKLFFAFKGQYVDGHNYVEKVINGDNVYAIIENPDFYINDKTILVKDTLVCLQELANRYRHDFDIPVIGITGSNGKTTTKELLSAVLSTKFMVHATKGNLNNHIGVPLTLLSCPKDAEMMIVEMGANKIGDIEELCQIAEPNYGLITNIGHAHIEGFGSYEGVIQTKTELYRFLELKKGIVFINTSDKVLSQNLPIGIQPEPYLEKEITIIDNGLNLIIQDELDGTQHTTEMYGIYNRDNILAAYTLGSYFKINPRLVIEAIVSYQPNMNRSQLAYQGNTTLILDAYNANPTSMRVSIHSLANLEDNRNKILVLGDMLELGEEEIRFHKEILDFIKEFEWFKIILVGKIFSNLKTTERTDVNRIEFYPNVEALNSNYKDNLTEFDDSIILVKASRSISLEKFSGLIYKETKA